ncbi:DUF1850 domain-containing protein [Shewanella sp. DC2-4]|uniref:DUF1850 domain-containing protein n=1 Tax=Shewanella sp. DC2-4 TaxID=2739431 RepID=UPI0015669C92|nr:DUF1850 domain-containing protein [Shewanella sp. DC2-4]NRD33916.1 DUF1850 domain-containing protein [Shewanella sp. DC2-4]
MLGLCLGLAGTLWAQVPTDNFTLAWNHSIEKIRWEEDYNVTPQGLVLVEARVKGTGAGMEIPDDAYLKNGSWHYQPKLPILPVLRLSRTPEAGDFELCFTQISGKLQCQAMSHWIGVPNKQTAAVELWGCGSSNITPIDVR